MKFFEGIGAHKESDSVVPDVDSALKAQQEKHDAGLLKELRETAGQKREWANTSRQEIVSDLRELSGIFLVEKKYPSSQSGHIQILDALIEAGKLPKQALEHHPIYLDGTMQMALRKISDLRAIDEQLAALELSLLPEAECEYLRNERAKELLSFEKEWKVE
jgi:hypothetical protein